MADGAVPAVAPSEAELLRRSDGRASAQVRINGRGPFPFIIDTGANRSSISAELAEALGLRELEKRVVNGVTGAELRKVVLIERLSAGSLHTGALEMPVIDRGALGTSVGLLAANELKRFRVVLDFARRRYEVTNSRRGRPPDGTVRLRANLRFGHLVETPCRLGGVAARCIIDTGADFSLVNLALMDKLRAHPRTEILFPDVKLYGATKAVISGEVVRLPQLKMDDLDFTGVTALATDAHVFEVWGLGDTPAMLIGMNVLRACDFLAIDFPQKALYMRLPS